MSKEKYTPLGEQLFYIFSSSELIIFYITLFYTVYNINLYALIIFILIILKTVMLKPLKYYTQNKSLGKRPNKAFNCTMMNCGGKNTSGGFPSGHMVLIGLLIFIILNYKDRTDSKNNTIYFIYIILILTTGIGRYFTRCHTIIQILSGLFIGFISGIIVYYADNLIENHIHKYKEHKNKFYNDINRILP
jgi:membrane-associated phospholipid phosphatase